jgi:uncharacterized protein
MAQFIDRRKNGQSKSTINRERFIRRFKKQIKSAVSDAISKRSITDIDAGEKIIIPKKDTSEPAFGFGQGGVREIVLPGNKTFSTGDKIQRPATKGTGSDSEASPDGEGVDDFIFQLSREEFLNIFFEDLELPDLIKTKLATEPNFEFLKGGFSSVGTPPNIHLIRSFRHAIARKRAFKGAYQQQILHLEKNLRILLEEVPKNKEKITAIKDEIKLIKQKYKKIPFIDTTDIRYMTKIKQPKNATQAVMFCLMDVSGSMDQAKKEMAKKFFILLYLFLKKNYKKIQIVFIRHHTTAKEVNEEEFFYSRETGGTVVSSALELAHEVMMARYPTKEWNIYMAQASDGDNWNADSPKCEEILSEKIMPYVQYYAYVEIMPRHHQSLWRSYLAIKEHFKNFSMKNITTHKDIYPVFHELFKRKS